MFENEKDFMFGGDLDLGSSDNDFGGFVAFDDDVKTEEIFGNVESSNTVAEENKNNVVPNTAGKEDSNVITVSDRTENVEEFKNERVESSTEKTSTGEISSEDSTDKPQDLWSELMAKEDEKQAEVKKNGLMQKLPIFEYGSAKEEIVDTSKTFEQLRLEKAEDFPELDEGENVKWKVTYGSIVKQVTTPKKTTIASLKTQIEESAEFMKFLQKPADDKKTKKSKGETDKKEIECKVVPTVTAKKKGVMAQYKGLFSTVEEAQSSGKVISFVPSQDGKVFEVRNNKIGTFIAQTENVTDFQRVRAGFIPALPKIPYAIWSEIISFFKSFIDRHGEFEALAYIYWSFDEGRYRVVIPRQKVSKDSVNTFLPDFDETKMLLVAEVHSHNTMPAYFSCTDNRDEKATRVYIVVGRMDKVFPDIKARISCGGKFVKIEPSEIMEGYNAEYPADWKNAVCTDKSTDEEESL